MNPISWSTKFLREIGAELRLVDWVGRGEVARYTGVVLAYTVILVISIMVTDNLLVSLRSLILDTNAII